MAATGAAGPGAWASQSGPRERRQRRLGRQVGRLACVRARVPVCVSVRARLYVRACALFLLPGPRQELERASRVSRERGTPPLFAQRLRLFPLSSAPLGPDCSMCPFALSWPPSPGHPRLRKQTCCSHLRRLLCAGDLTLN